MGSPSRQILSTINDTITLQSDPEESVVRYVAGCVPYIITSQNKLLILVVSSRKNPNKWGFPKGGHEPGEDLQTTALRESWEEAGVRGILRRKLAQGVMRHKRKENRSQSGLGRVIEEKEVLAAVTMSMTDNSAHSTTIVEESTSSEETNAFLQEDLNFTPVEPDSESRVVERITYYEFYELEVETKRGPSKKIQEDWDDVDVNDEIDWPERGERSRKWVSVHQAYRCVKHHHEGMAKAILEFDASREKYLVNENI